MRKTLILTALAATAALAALPARAGDVQWSVGISAPIGYSGSVGTMISSGPIYAPAPVYIEWSDGNGEAVRLRARRLKVEPGEAVVHALRSLLGADAVRYVKVG